MCGDEAKQAFIFLKAFDEAGGSFGASDIESIEASMKKISLREFGAEKYASRPYDLTSISAKEFSAGNIERNSDLTVSLTPHGESVISFLFENFISRSNDLSHS